MSLRDHVRRLMPGITEEHLGRVCDELAPRVRVTSIPWAGDEAPAGAALPATGGSGGAGGETGPTHQPTPRVGDVWESAGGGVGRIKIAEDAVPTWSAEVVESGKGFDARFPNDHRWTLVERDGRPWPPEAPEGPKLEKPRPVSEAPDVEPATDEQIADCWESFSEYPNEWAGWIADSEAPRLIPALIARVRQEEATAYHRRHEVQHWQEKVCDRERERDEAVARAEASEADYRGAQRQVDRMRPLARAALDHVDFSSIAGTWDALCREAEAYRAAVKEAQ